MPGRTTGPNAMDEKTLTRLLRAEGAEAERPGRGCSDEAQLSAYVEHGIPEEQRAKVEAHLADCEACLGQIAFLARQPAELAEPATSVPPGAVARARDLVALPPSPWRPFVLRWGTALAGVACVVLVNQCRLVGVIWVGVHAPHWFDAAHGWVAPMVLVAATVASFLAWARTVR